jgi:hypothetical protein
MTLEALMALTEGFVQIPLVKKCLLQLSKSINTPVVFGSQLDEWVIKILYGAKALPAKEKKIVVTESLAEVQNVYNAAKLEAKMLKNDTRIKSLKQVRPFVMPWMETSGEP